MAGNVLSVSSPAVAQRMLETKCLVVKSTDAFYSDSGGDSTIAIGDEKITELLLVMNFDKSVNDAGETTGLHAVDADDLSVSSGDLLIASEVLDAGDLYVIWFI